MRHHAVVVRCARRLLRSVVEFGDAGEPPDGSRRDLARYRPSDVVTFRLGRTILFRQSANQKRSPDRPIGQHAVSLRDPKLTSDGPVGDGFCKR